MVDSPWNLIRVGEPQAALEQMRRALAAKSSSSTIMELGVGLLWVFEYESAWKHFHKAIEADPHGVEAFYAMGGVAQWCLGRRTDAVSTWKNGLKCRYADAAGGVSLPLLLFVAAVLDSKVIERSEAESLLVKRAKDRRVKNWPGPLAQYLLGQIGERELLDKCVGCREVITFQMNWHAGFYLGIAAMSRGDQSQFTRHVIQTATITDDEIDPLSPLFLSRLWFSECHLARFLAAHIGKC